MSAPQKIIDLVREFEENEIFYKNEKEFDEENTKIQFLNPFLEELGWNVRNEGLKPWEREVIFEASIKDGKKNRAPDYAFMVDGETVFFLEAKKPSRDIVKDKSHAYQVRRYGWSANLPLCILTDFEELAIYDTRIRPEKNQSATIGRVKYYHYKDYIKKWDEIYNIFSKEAVLSGKFDEFAGIIKEPGKGSTEVDDEFIKDIEKWRLDLARNIAIRNTDLDIEPINYAVQLIIDRIIFLRIAEDRKFEPYGRLLKLTQKPDIYKNFAKICLEADQKYNSGLFHFSDYDKEDYTTDKYTLDLNIDDKVFKKIFKNLYYPDSPYEFSVISTEILGKVYEQFLGNIIRLTEGHHAKVEEKPEVKKGGGVYYTPQYIVDYIVENTLGEKIKGKTPNQISKIKIIDPSCGSGSFLIRAYDYLLKYHLKYYLSLEKRPKNVLYKLKDGQYRLTIAEKKRILKNNIFGVDIDTLAVEVTKLSLLLKVLEDQNKEKVEQQTKLFHERVLPNLSSNVKNGNSIIDYSMIPSDETNINKIRKIKPFQWENEFEDIINGGGFDIIIGNPPYVAWNIISDRKYYEKGIYKDLKYKCRPNHEDAHPNLYMFFLVQSSLLSKGIISFILPQEWLESTQDFRDYLLEHNGYIHILKFNPEFRVFKNKEGVVGTNSLIVTLYKDKEDKFKLDEITELNEKKVEKILQKNEIEEITHISKKERFYSNRWEFYQDITEKILRKEEVDENLVKLNNKKYFEVFGGFQPNVELSKKFIIENVNKLNDLEKQLTYPCIYDSKNFKRYEMTENTNRWIVTNKHFQNEIEFKEKCPNLYEHLVNNITKKGKKWWEFPNIRNMKLIEEYDEKLFHPRTALKNSFCYDNTRTVTKGTNSIIVSKILSPKYVLAILNSSLANYFYSDYGMGYHGKINKYEPKQVKEYMLPIKIIPIEEQSYYVEKVNKLMQYKKQLKNKTITPEERKIITKTVFDINENINNEVYELYGITTEEKKIIEENI